MPGYEQVYALRYNPFSLLGVLDLPNALGDELVSMPLQMAKDDRLVPFYVNDIYPATDRTGREPAFDYFVSSMERRGYSNGSTIRPKSLSKYGRVVLIRGEKGTGKTTLAHRMMNWLQSCGGGWNYVEWHGAGRNSEQQKLSLEDDFQNEILDGGEGRFLCLLEDIRDDADERLFEIYPKILPKRTLCMFITTDDPELRKKLYGTFNPQVLLCETRTLTAEQAGAYCRKRMAAARSRNSPEWIEDHPLFPFSDDIVRRLLSPLRDLQEYFDVPGSIGVRELNRVLAVLLEDGLGVDEAFDISGIPASGASELLIRPAGLDVEAA